MLLFCDSVSGGGSGGLVFVLGMIALVALAFASRTTVTFTPPNDREKQ